MAHFAKLGIGNIVEQAIVVSDNELLVDGIENEQRGVEFLQNLFSNRDLYIQTSYNNNFRKQFAGVGCTYDKAADVFVSIQPHPSWTLDSSHDWQPPIPKPDGQHRWNEQTQAWDAVEE